MIILKREELINVVGGSISGTMLNAISKGINTIFEIGQSLGSSIRRFITGKLC
jgi:hypothetical protein